jgi:hypothetical protein
VTDEQAKQQRPEPAQDSTTEHNESTEGLLDEEHLREQADRVSRDIQEAKNRNP